MKLLFTSSLLLLVPLLLTADHIPSNETDRLSLFHFKQSITSDPNGILTSWNHSFHFCHWFGITCIPSRNRVASLVLPGQNLAGSLSPHISNLTFLHSINLNSNFLRGPIPPQLGNLRRLRNLNLSHNLFQGEIPINITLCSNLRFLLLGDNNLTGKILPEIGSLEFLQRLRLGPNNLIGKLPASLGNLSMLVNFGAAYNQLIGEVPESYGRLSRMEVFAVGINRLSGTIPASILNLSSLQILTFTDNQMEGDLPEDIGFSLPNLQAFAISRNRFTGKLPISFCNASNLEMLNMNWNQFHGRIPNCLGNAPRFQELDIGVSYLGSNSTGDFAFLDSLANCSQLQHIGVAVNNLGGDLPDSIGNLSAATFRELWIDTNYITGFIPPGLENLKGLADLDLAENLFSGEILSYLGNLPNLQRLELGKNQLQGRIPPFLCNVSQLFELNISHNLLQGDLPPSIGSCQKLTTLDVSGNQLTGAIPVEILRISSLSNTLNLSRNSFTGHLPADGWNLPSLTGIDISYNNLTGEIPAAIGDCKSLVSLYLQSNSFNGSIPEAALASLRGIQYIDLSRNNLTGPIPARLQNMYSLQYLNLSFNALVGEVPMKGIFATNATSISLTGNEMLCGGISMLHLPKCSSKSVTVKLAAIIATVSVFLALVLVGSISFYMRRRLTKRRKTAQDNELGSLEKVSYRDLHQATNGFSSDNIIGSGGFGTVFKGVLNSTGTAVAVKVLKTGDRKVDRSLKAECRALRNVRHRNLVRLITYCSSLDYRGNEFKALVYQFMENGSLEKWLHSEHVANSLSLVQRINIALDVATALHYLHELSGGVSIAHCDLKPSNVLLDGDMVAHVGDFGMARILSSSTEIGIVQSDDTGSLGTVKGTIGYAPPEYGTSVTEGTKEGDVYSYGILVLEMLSGKRPTDEMFGGGSCWLSLREWVKAALPNEIGRVLDPKLSGEAKEQMNKCVMSMLEIGVVCSAQSPAERMKIADVTLALSSIRDSFWRYSIPPTSRARLRN
ncbi:Probable LRR receptor-like serine/threonine-protein kinase At3g47570 [Linum grandiflorum]